MLLAKRMLEDGGEPVDRTDEVELAESLRAVVTAYPIVHRVGPTATEVAAILVEWHGDEALVDRAVRSAERAEEKKAARRCKAWRAADGHWRVGRYLRRRAKRWCDAHPEEADRRMTPVGAVQRQRALERLGWEIDPAEHEGHKE